MKGYKRHLVFGPRGAWLALVCAWFAVFLTLGTTNALVTDAAATRVTIYLNATGNSVWNGDCGDAQLCSDRNDPCFLESAIFPDQTGPFPMVCDIVLLEDDSWESGIVMRFNTTSAATGLQVNVLFESGTTWLNLALEMFGMDNETDLTNALNVGPFDPQRYPLTGAPVEVSDCQFTFTNVWTIENLDFRGRESSSLSIMGDAETTVRDCSFRRVRVMPSSFHHTFFNCTFDASSNTLFDFSSYRPIRLTFDQCRARLGSDPFLRVSLYQHPTLPIYDIIIRNSSFVGTSNSEQHIFSILVPTLARHFSRSSLSPTSSSPHTRPMTFTIESSHFSGTGSSSEHRPLISLGCDVTILDSTLSQLHINQEPLKGENCTFIARNSNFDSTMWYLDHLTVNLKNVKIIEDTSYLQLRPHPDYRNNYTLDNVTFDDWAVLHVDYTDWYPYEQPWSHLLPDVRLHSPSTLSIFNLDLQQGLRLVVDNIEIRGSLAADTNEGPPLFNSTLSSSTSPDNTWNFWSIGVTNVTLDVFNVKNFIYTASDRDVGIHNVLQEFPISIVPSIPNITLVWPYDDNDDPEYDKQYVIFNRTTSEQLDEVYYVRPLGSPYEFAIDTSSTIPTFRMLSKTWRTIPSDQCPPVPPGFLCSANGVFFPLPLNTTTITLPPNVGLITVFGNLTISDALLFEGSGTSLNVTGCANVPKLEIALDVSQPLPGGSVNYITQSPECEAMKPEISLVQAPLTKRKCEESKAERDATPKTHLSVLFRVDDSKCDKKKNLGWIAAVVIVVLAVLIIVALVSVLTWKRSKAKFAQKLPPSDTR